MHKQISSLYVSISGNFISKEYTPLLHNNPNIVAKIHINHDFLPSMFSLPISCKNCIEQSMITNAIKKENLTGQSTRDPPCHKSSVPLTIIGISIIIIISKFFPTYFLLIFLNIKLYIHTIDGNDKFISIYFAIFQSFDNHIDSIAFKYVSKKVACTRDDFEIASNAGSVIIALSATEIKTDIPNKNAYSPLFSFVTKIKCTPLLIRIKSNTIKLI